MRNEFMLAINQVCAERQLAKEVVLEAVEAALVTACKRDFGVSGDITARIDPETGVAQVFTHKVVSEEIEEPKSQISLEEARELDPDIQLEDIILIETTPTSFGRIAAQTAKQVILQRIREAERDALYGVYAEQEGEIVNGTVQRIDSQVVIVNLGKAEGTLPRSEQIPGERYRLNQRLRAYVMEVEKSTRGPRIVLSRNHRNMLRRLMELEVPEIFNGAVEIKAIAREPGARSKVAVVALRAGVDPVGSCVGMRGTRIQGIVSELSGEKIDVVEWNADLGVFIANALSPAQVVKVHLTENADGKTATVIVPDKQLSLAIGKEGQNARLAAKLTGWRIDIKSASEAAEAVFAAPEPILQPQEGLEEDLLARAEAILSAQLAEEASAGGGFDLDTAFGEGFEDLPDFSVDDADLADEVAELPEMSDELPAAEAATDLVDETDVEDWVEDDDEADADESAEYDEDYELEEYEPEAPEESEGESVEEEVVEWSDEDGEDEEDEEKKRKAWHKKHAMVFDEKAGKVVAKRKRKPSRRQDIWEMEED
jgi:transcription termination/antitermination protein NusA